jgi:hypothetical protein
MKVHQKIASIFLLLAFAGCASQQQGGAQPQSAPAPASTPATAPAAPAPAATSTSKAQPNSADGTVVGTPAKNSKFAKLKIGMGRREVEDLIGQPNDQHTYTTGKAFIPFYFGKDAYRFETFYKKEGSLTFEGGGVTGTSGKLIRITVDTNATGYAHND